MLKREHISDKELQILEQQAFDAIQRIFPCEDNLLNHIPMDDIVRHFQAENLSVTKPFLFRIAGQSGSGKSSQLTPAVQEALSNISYLKINVGAFAPFHPNYQLWQRTEPDKMRENTNGFALRALILFYQYCIRSRINVVLDMTLLEPEVDLYLMALAKQYGYRIYLHVLCVPKKVSDTFIRRRQSQTGRYVKPASSNYFFNALAPSLKALTQSDFFDSTDIIWLWTHCQTYPVRQTSFRNKSVPRLLEKYRRQTCMKDPKPLLKAKKYWMKQLGVF